MKSVFSPSPLYVGGDQTRAVLQIAELHYLVRGVHVRLGAETSQWRCRRG